METPSQISIVSGGPAPAASFKYPAAIPPPVAHLVREEPHEAHLAITPTVTALSLAALDLLENLSSLQNELVLDELEQKARCRLKIFLDIGG